MKLRKLDVIMAMKGISQSQFKDIVNETCQAFINGRHRGMVDKYMVDTIRNLILYEHAMIEHDDLTVVHFNHELPDEFTELFIRVLYNKIEDALVNSPHRDIDEQPVMYRICATNDPGYFEQEGPLWMIDMFPYDEVAFNLPITEEGARKVLAEVLMKLAGPVVFNDFTDEMIGADEESSNEGMSVPDINNNMLYTIASSVARKAIADFHDSLLFEIKSLRSMQSNITDEPHI